MKSIWILNDLALSIETAEVRLPGMPRKPKMIDTKR